MNVGLNLFTVQGRRLDFIKKEEERLVFNYVQTLGLEQEWSKRWMVQRYTPLVIEFVVV